MPYGQAIDKYYPVYYAKEAITSIYLGCNIDKVKKDGYLNRVSEMNASDDILIRIITKNNLCFKIRTADDFMRHYDYFKMAMDEGQSNIDVDMTTENNVIIKDRNPTNEEDE